MKCLLFFKAILNRILFAETPWKQKRWLHWEANPRFFLSWNQVTHPASESFKSCPHTPGPEAVKVSHSLGKWPPSRKPAQQWGSSPTLSFFFLLLDVSLWAYWFLFWIFFAHHPFFLPPHFPFSFLSFKFSSNFFSSNS